MRIMVDMSATILHHGHIRLLKQAKQLGTVIVGLTSDVEILNRQGYRPELSFEFRKEILEAIKYVDEVVEVPWLITDETLRQFKVDILLHGEDNSNQVSKDKLIIRPRTRGISSSEMRIRALDAIVSIKNRKALLTAGPGSLLTENLLGIEPCFGRGDRQYQDVEDRVLTRLRQMTGHKHIARLQGSASLALEVAIRNFAAGRVLVVTTGYYADRLAAMCKNARALGSITEVDVISARNVDEAYGRYDWVVTVYTETSVALRNDILQMRKLADRLGAQLIVDSTGSIGLEDGHEVADVIAYSSCKGLFGLTGASFIAYNREPQVKEHSFNMSLATHINRGMTGPYHAIYSLDAALERTKELRESVRVGKDLVCRRYANRLMRPSSEQPLLCTLLRGTVKAKDDAVILYHPRAAAQGTSVVCHLGEGNLGRLARGEIYSRIEVID